ncbi:MAG: hypothetical protein NTV36_02825 [Candidatus Staskawiczbacteria bacterium]|nr:hypothetical protein [Candidatus Staskawiczbacteria bacterium]
MPNPELNEPNIYRHGDPDFKEPSLEKESPAGSEMSSDISLTTEDRLRIYFGQIFDAFNDGKRRLETILKMKYLSDFLQNNLNEGQTVNLLKNYSNLQNKDDFINKVTSVVLPIYKNIK